LTLVAVSQRVVTDARDGERRDALDQRWAGFLAACGLRALPVPNRPEDAVDLVETAGARGVLLTGGGDIGTLGGKDAERDETEALLVGWARWHGFPIVGVCRGMQVIQALFGVPLVPVSGHVGNRHPVIANGASMEVNSYHGFGTTQSVPDLEPCAVAEDGVVEAVRHRHEPIRGIMWHPEREAAINEADVALFRNAFAAGQ